MDDRDQRRYDAYKRGSVFCRDNKADFAPESDFHGHFTALIAAQKDVDDARADQVGGGSASKASILDAIRLDCRNIRRTATVIGEDTAGFADSFPAAGHSDISVITTAHGYLKTLKPLETDPPALRAAKIALGARFIAKELPADFVEDLRLDCDAYGTAGGTQESKRREKVEDTQAISEALTEGGKQIRQLNAIMHNKYTRKPEKLRGWKSAVHVERAPQRPDRAEPEKPADSQTSPGANPKS